MLEVVEGVVALLLCMLGDPSGVCRLGNPSEVSIINLIILGLIWVRLSSTQL